MKEKKQSGKRISRNASWILENGLKKELVKAGKSIGGRIDKSSINLQHPALAEHGDFSSNLALVLAKELKENPRNLAQKILNELKGQKNPFIEKIEIAGPGFINFFLKTDCLIKEAELLLSREYQKKLKEVGRGKTLVIDYSAPNIAKPFGIGHLRSTNIGQAVYNLYSFLGWKTIGDNHLGDWGTQFGKLIVAIKKWGPKDLKNLSIEDLEKLYVKFHQQAEKDESLEKKARDWFKKLEEENQEAKKIWQFCVDLSLKEFARVYRLLGVKIDYAYGESFYHFAGWMKKVKKDLQKKKLWKKSQGAYVMEVPGQKLPAMLVKSDGGTTYLFRDLATIKFRVKKWHPDLIVYEVGADQKLHFQQIFKACQKIGYLPVEKLVYLPHGLIRWKHAKFSTRKGDTIHLEEILKESIERARKIIEQSQTGRSLKAGEKEKIAKAVGVGGIKFNDLKQELEKDIIFDWEKVLSLEGYSAPYLQYTYARCASVLKKAGIKTLPESLEFEPNKEELVLLKTFYQFTEIVLIAANNFAPHLLAQYLFDLSQKYNLFYQKHRIIKLKVKGEKLKIEGKDQIQEFRLFLTKVTAQVLKMGLGILGIEVLEKM